MAAAAQPSKEVTTVHVGGVSFGFYTDEEIRKLSVKRIISPIARDNLSNAIPGGLYDPAMGPSEPHATCKTCGLLYAHCPGHFGHIELAVPLYNPLVFGYMYKLLRCTCLHCYSLKMDAEELGRYRRRLTLLAQGRLVEAAAQDTGGSAAAVKAMAQMEEGFAGEDALLERPQAGPLKHASKADLDSAYEREGDVARSGRVTQHTIEAMRECVRALMKRMPTGPCSNCKAVNPAIRKEGASKIFQMPLSAKAITQNSMGGTPILGALATASAARQQEAAALEAAAATAAALDLADRKKRRMKAAGGADSSDEETEVLDTRQSEAKNAVMRARRAAAAAAKGEARNDKPRYLTPSEVQEVMRRMWAKNAPILALLFAADKSATVRAGARSAPEGYRMFFLSTIAVAPNKFRPMSKMGEMSFEHPQNTVLTQVLNSNLELVSAAAPAPAPEPGGPPGLSAKDAAALELGRSLAHWLNLQGAVNALIDSSTAADKSIMGIRQQLEKKEGLFRKNMMGKRVNFACRSVISPDPYIATGEIGVPPYFAKRLSFPERVTAWNVEELRTAVRNGPAVHPGAVAVEDELGRVISLANFSAERRDAVAKQLLSKSAAAAMPGSAKAAGGSSIFSSGNGKIVYRHLRDGDLMLTNRQPTLHKPGLMAHRARVLAGERTIRMHYANCQTFNADFDGDEINLHFPQDHMGRAEGYGIVAADEQYVVPTDGQPIRGLIQDHVVSGVLMTKRDGFFTREMFMQLLYAACCPSRPGLKDALCVRLPTPAIIKPKPLFTGKQVITAVVAHCTRGMPPVSLRSKCKTSPESFGASSGESFVEFCGGDMVTGLMDKAQYGNYGLVHSVQELYGCSVAGRLLSCLSRLFTHYLQHHGFTCGIDDVLLLEAAESRRRDTLAHAEITVMRASATVAGLTHVAGMTDKQLQSQGAAIETQLAEMYRSDFLGTGIKHDRTACSAVNPLSSDVVKACLPAGQMKPFRRNCMALMTGTGAKGSQVNFSQISCLLGQQELEGRRVPRMSSGKTLPCFAAFDAGARSGGFIGDRFLTGLRPQEYYFHCMAGRDGLVDTTVKTSRSGYLQRCLVKNLEALRVHYDSTVRDDADGSIIQFHYGEDGIDVMRTGYLQKFGFLASNAARFAQQLDLHAAAAASLPLGTAAAERRVQSSVKKRQAQLMQQQQGGRVPQLGEALPLQASQSPGLLGVTSEAFSDALCSYIRQNPDGLLRPQEEKRSSEAGKLDPLSSKGFQRLMELKYMRSQAAAGEAVGVLAAQSVGEPSTQMTLNTFHMAGRGEANVTLGIPRLRELLMTAAQKIKTPVMVLPPLPGSRQPAADMRKLATRLRRLSLGDVLTDISVSEVSVTSISGASGLSCQYRARLRFFPQDRIPAAAHLSFDELEATFRQAFIPALQLAVKQELRKMGASMISMSSLAKMGEAPSGAGLRDEGAPDTKKAGRKADVDENEEADEENAEGKLRFSGGRGEAATYDDGDEEDRQIAAKLSTEDLGDDDDDDDNEEQEAEDEGAGDDLQDEAPSTGAAPKGAKAVPAKLAPALDLAAETSEADCSCEALLTLPLGAPKLLMAELVQRVAANTMIRATAGIARAQVVAGEPPHVEAEGINFPGVWQHQDLVDVNAITTNDVGAILSTFGVEAARATVVAEVVKVFGVYGIGVDRRHLGLIGDYMTHQGGYRACSRLGIDSSASPFLKITFETASHFLTEATMRGDTDLLATPASRLVLGRMVELGTGCMDLTQRLDSLQLGK